MINVLASANNSAELYQKIPAALEVLKAYRQRLLNGQVPTSDLIVTKHMSKEPKNYKQQVSQVIVAQQLAKKGVEVNAGNNVKFLFTNSEHKRYERRVKALATHRERRKPRHKKVPAYALRFSRQSLSFSGYTTQTVYDAVKSQHQTSLK